MRWNCTNDLFVSQSLLTGESTILEKNAERLNPMTHTSLNSFSNLAFMGTIVISGSGEGIVLAAGINTVYGSYLYELQQTKRGFEQGVNSADIRRDPIAGRKSDNVADNKLL